MGASVAWHLRRLGIEDVVLVERDVLASGSTSKSAGGFRAQFADELNIRIALRSLDELEAMDGVELHQHGYLFLLDNDGDVERFRAALALQHCARACRRASCRWTRRSRSSRSSTPRACSRRRSASSTATCTPEDVVQWYARGARRPPGLRRSPASTSRKAGSSAVETTQGRIATEHRRLLRGRLVAGDRCDGGRGHPGARRAALDALHASRRWAAGTSAADRRLLDRLLLPPRGARARVRRPRADARGGRRARPRGACRCSPSCRCSRRGGATTR